MSRFVISIVIILLCLSCLELLFELGLVCLDSASDVLQGQVILHLAQLHINALLFGDLEGVDAAILGFNLVFATSDMDNLCYVETFD